MRTSTFGQNPAHTAEASTPPLWLLSLEMANCTCKSFPPLTQWHVPPMPLLPNLLQLRPTFIGALALSAQWTRVNDKVAPVARDPQCSPSGSTSCHQENLRADFSSWSLLDPRTRGWGSLEFMIFYSPGWKRPCFVREEETWHQPKEERRRQVAVKVTCEASFHRVHSQSVSEGMGKL